jgi:hypothetical protein
MSYDPVESEKAYARERFLSALRARRKRAPILASIQVLTPSDLRFARRQLLLDSLIKWTSSSGLSADFEADSKTQLLCELDHEADQPLGK